MGCLCSKRFKKEAKKLDPFQSYEEAKARNAHTPEDPGKKMKKIIGDMTFTVANQAAAGKMMSEPAAKAALSNSVLTIQPGKTIVRNMTLTVANQAIADKMLQDTDVDAALSNSIAAHMEGVNASQVSTIDIGLVPSDIGVNLQITYEISAPEDARTEISVKPITAFDTETFKTRVNKNLVNAGVPGGPVTALTIEPGIEEEGNMTIEPGRKIQGSMTFTVSGQAVADKMIAGSDAKTALSDSIAANIEVVYAGQVRIIDIRTVPSDSTDSGINLQITYEISTPEDSAAEATVKPITAVDAETFQTMVNKKLVDAGVPGGPVTALTIEPGIEEEGDMTIEPGQQIEGSMTFTVSGQAVADKMIADPAGKAALSDSIAASIGAVNAGQVSITDIKTAPSDSSHSGINLQITYEISTPEDSAAGTAVKPTTAIDTELFKTIVNQNLVLAGFRAVSITALIIEPCTKKGSMTSTVADQAAADKRTLDPAVKAALSDSIATNIEGVNASQVRIIDIIMVSSDRSFDLQITYEISVPEHSPNEISVKPITAIDAEKVKTTVNQKLLDARVPGVPVIALTIEPGIKTEGNMTCTVASQAAADKMMSDPAVTAALGDSIAANIEGVNASQVSITEIKPVPSDSGVNLQITYEISTREDKTTGTAVEPITAIDAEIFKTTVNKKLFDVGVPGEPVTVLTIDPGIEEEGEMAIEPGQQIEGSMTFTVVGQAAADKIMSDPAAKAALSDSIAVNTEMISAGQVRILDINTVSNESGVSLQITYEISAPEDSAAVTNVKPITAVDAETFKIIVNKTLVNAGVPGLPVTALTIEPGKKMKGEMTCSVADQAAADKIMLESAVKGASSNSMAVANQAAADKMMSDPAAKAALSASIAANIERVNASQVSISSINKVISRLPGDSGVNLQIIYEISIPEDAASKISLESVAAIDAELFKTMVNQKLADAGVSGVSVTALTTAESTGQPAAPAGQNIEGTQGGPAAIENKPPTNPLPADLPPQQPPTSYNDRQFLDDGPGTTPAVKPKPAEKEYVFENRVATYASSVSPEARAAGKVVKDWSVLEIQPGAPEDAAVSKVHIPLTLGHPYSVEFKARAVATVDVWVRSSNMPLLFLRGVPDEEECLMLHSKPRSHTRAGLYLFERLGPYVQGVEVGVGDRPKKGTAKKGYGTLDVQWSGRMIEASDKGRQIIILTHGKEWDEEGLKALWLETCKAADLNQIVTRSKIHHPENVKEFDLYSTLLDCIQNQGGSIDFLFGCLLLKAPQSDEISWDESQDLLSRFVKLAIANFKPRRWPDILDFAQGQLTQWQGVTNGLLGALLMRLIDAETDICRQVASSKFGEAPLENILEEARTLVDELTYHFHLHSKRDTEWDAWLGDLWHLGQTSAGGLAQLVRHLSESPGQAEDKFVVNLATRGIVESFPGKTRMDDPQVIANFKIFGHIPLLHKKLQAQAAKLLRDSRHLPQTERSELLLNLVEQVPFCFSNVILQGSPGERLDLGSLSSVNLSRLFLALLRRNPFDARDLAIVNITEQLRFTKPTAEMFTYIKGFYDRAVLDEQPQRHAEQTFQEMCQTHLKGLLPEPPRAAYLDARRQELNTVDWMLADLSEQRMSFLISKTWLSEWRTYCQYHRHEVPGPLLSVDMTPDNLQAVSPSVFRVFMHKYGLAESGALVSHASGRTDAFVLWPWGVCQAVDVLTREELKKLLKLEESIPQDLRQMLLPEPLFKLLQNCRAWLESVVQDQVSASAVECLRLDHQHRCPNLTLQLVEAIRPDGQANQKLTRFWATFDGSETQMKIFQDVALKFMSVVGDQDAKGDAGTALVELSNAYIARFSASVRDAEANKEWKALEDLRDDVTRLSRLLSVSLFIRFCHKNAVMQTRVDSGLQWKKVRAMLETWDEAVTRYRDRPMDASQMEQMLEDFGIEDEGEAAKPIRELTEIFGEALADSVQFYLLVKRKKKYVEAFLEFMHKLHGHFPAVPYRGELIDMLQRFTSSSGLKKQADQSKLSRIGGQLLSSWNDRRLEFLKTLTDRLPNVKAAQETLESKDFAELQRIINSLPGYVEEQQVFASLYDVRATLQPIFEPEKHFNDVSAVLKWLSRPTDEDMTRFENAVRDLEQHLAVFDKCKREWTADEYERCIEQIEKALARLQVVLKPNMDAIMEISLEAVEDWLVFKCPGWKDEWTAFSDMKMVEYRMFLYGEPKEVDRPKVETFHALSSTVEQLAKLHVRMMQGGFSDFVGERVLVDLNVDLFSRGVEQGLTILAQGWSRATDGGRALSPRAAGNAAEQTVADLARAVKELQGTLEEQEDALKRHGGTFLATGLTARLLAALKSGPRGEQEVAAYSEAFDLKGIQVPDTGTQAEQIIALDVILRNRLIAQEPGVLKWNVPIPKPLNLVRPGRCCLIVTDPKRCPLLQVAIALYATLRRRLPRWYELLIYGEQDNHVNLDEARAFASRMARPKKHGAEAGVLDAREDLFVVCGWSYAPREHWEMFRDWLDEHEAARQATVFLTARKMKSPHTDCTVLAELTDATIAQGMKQACANLWMQVQKHLPFARVFDSQVLGNKDFMAGKSFRIKTKYPEAQRISLFHYYAPHLLLQALRRIYSEKNESAVWINISANCPSDVEAALLQLLVCGFVLDPRGTPVALDRKRHFIIELPRKKGFPLCRDALPKAVIGPPTRELETRLPEVQVVCRYLRELSKPPSETLLVCRSRGQTDFLAEKAPDVDFDEAIRLLRQHGPKFRGQPAVDCSMTVVIQFVRYLHGQLKRLESSTVYFLNQFMADMSRNSCRLKMVTVGRLVNIASKMFDAAVDADSFEITRGWDEATEDPLLFLSKDAEVTLSVFLAPGKKDSQFNWTEFGFKEIDRADSSHAQEMLEQCVHVPKVFARLESTVSVHIKTDADRNAVKAALNHELSVTTDVKVCGEDLRQGYKVTSHFPQQFREAALPLNLTFSTTQLDTLKAGLGDDMVVLTQMNLGSVSLQPGMALHRETQEGKPVKKKADLDKLELPATLTFREAAALEADQGYVLTMDNVLKMILITQRLENGPVLLMGETGCGKTSLVTYLCKVAGIDLHALDVHGGIEMSDVRAFMEPVLKRAMANPARHVWVFLDELNTSACIDVFAEMLCEGRFDGKPLPDNMRVLGACNPYRKSLASTHLGTMMVSISGAGEGARGTAPPTLERNISPSRGLAQPTLERNVSPSHAEEVFVYQVLPLPTALVDFIWDFGSLKEKERAQYVHEMVEQHAPACGKALASSTRKALPELVVDAMRIVLRNEDPSCVSLRDARRVVVLAAWFCKNKVGAGHAAILATAVGFYYRLMTYRDREEFKQKVPAALYAPHKSVDELLRKYQDGFTEVVHVPEGVARNEALTSNIFVMLTAVANRIPVFVVGKPGQSKTLAVSLLCSGRSSTEVKTTVGTVHAPLLSVLSYQCSEHTTAASLHHHFVQGEQLQEKRGGGGGAMRGTGVAACRVQVVIFLDEVGLAEKNTTDRPLKVLHKHLENPSVGFVGLSNTPLDASKMNRAIYLSHLDPGKKDLKSTARVMLQKSGLGEKLVDELAESISQLFVQVLENLKKHKDGVFEHLADHRGFYNLIKGLVRLLSKDALAGEWIKGQRDVCDLVLRNLGGVPYEHLESLVLSPMGNCGLGESVKHWRETPYPENARRMMEQNLADSEGRHLMIIAPSEVRALHFLFSRGLVQTEEAEVFFGSSFPEDAQSKLYIFRLLSKIRMCMEVGKKVVLLNLGRLHESLYEVLNQQYIYFNGKPTCRIALGAESRQVPVHKDFRCIVVLTKKEVHQEATEDAYGSLKMRFLSALLSRFEKVVLDDESELPSRLLPAIEAVRTWKKSLGDRNDAKQSHELFPGAGDDAPGLMLKKLLWEAGEKAVISPEDAEKGMRKKLVDMMPAYDILKNAGKLGDGLAEEYVGDACHGSLEALLAASRNQKIADSSLIVRTYDEQDVEGLNSDLPFVILALHDFSTEYIFNRALERGLPKIAGGGTLVIDCVEAEVSQPMLQHVQRLVAAALHDMPLSERGRRMLFLLRQQLKTDFGDEWTTTDFGDEWTHYWVDSVRDARETHGWKAKQGVDREAHAGQHQDAPAGAALDWIGQQFRSIFKPEDAPVPQDVPASAPAPHRIRPRLQLGNLLKPPASLGDTLDDIVCDLLPSFKVCNYVEYPAEIVKKRPPQQVADRLFEDEPFLNTVAQRLVPALVDDPKMQSWLGLLSKENPFGVHEPVVEAAMHALEAHVHEAFAELWCQLDMGANADAYSEGFRDLWLALLVSQTLVPLDLTRRVVMRRCNVTDVPKSARFPFVGHLIQQFRQLDAPLWNFLTGQADADSPDALWTKAYRWLSGQFVEILQGLEEKVPLPEEWTDYQEQLLDSFIGAAAPEIENLSRPIAKHFLNLEIGEPQSGLELLRRVAVASWVARSALLRDEALEAAIKWMMSHEGRLKAPKPVATPSFKSLLRSAGFGVKDAEGDEASIEETLQHLLLRAGEIVAQRARAGEFVSMVELAHAETILHVAIPESADKSLSDLANSGVDSANLLVILSIYADLTLRFHVPAEQREGARSVLQSWATFLLGIEGEPVPTASVDSRILVNMTRVNANLAFVRSACPIAEIPLLSWVAQRLCAAISSLHETGADAVSWAAPPKGMLDLLSTPKFPELVALEMLRHLDLEPEGAKEMERLLLNVLTPTAQVVNVEMMAELGKQPFARALLIRFERALGTKEEGGEDTWDSMDLKEYPILSQVRLMAELRLAQRQLKDEVHSILVKKSPPDGRVKVAVRKFAEIAERLEPKVIKAWGIETLSNEFGEETVLGSDLMIQSGGGEDGEVDGEVHGEVHGEVDGEAPHPKEYHLLAPELWKPVASPDKVSALPRMGREYAKTLGLLEEKKVEEARQVLKSHTCGGLVLNMAGFTAARKGIKFENPRELAKKIAGAGLLSKGLMDDSESQVLAALLEEESPFGKLLREAPDVDVARLIVASVAAALSASRNAKNGLLRDFLVHAEKFRERLVWSMSRIKYYDQLHDIRVSELAHRLQDTKYIPIYECPNGHPYWLGNCSRPATIYTCCMCEEQIGGKSHTLVAGNKNVPRDQWTKPQKGFCHSRWATSSEHLQPRAFLALQFWTHAVLLGSLLLNLSNESAENARQFLPLRFPHSSKDALPEDLLNILRHLLEGLMSPHIAPANFESRTAAVDFLLLLFMDIDSWGKLFSGSTELDTEEGLKSFEARFTEFAESSRKFEVVMPCKAHDVEKGLLSQTTVILNIPSSARLGDLALLDALPQLMAKQAKNRDACPTFWKLHGSWRQLLYCAELPKLLRLPRILFENFSGRLSKVEAMRKPLRDALGDRCDNLWNEFAEAWNNVRGLLTRVECADVRLEELDPERPAESLALLVDLEQNLGLQLWNLVTTIANYQNDFLDSIGQTSVANVPLLRFERRFAVPLSAFAGGEDAGAGDTWAVDVVPCAFRLDAKGGFDFNPEAFELMSQAMIAPLLRINLEPKPTFTFVSLPSDDWQSMLNKVLPQERLPDDIALPVKKGLTDGQLTPELAQTLLNLLIKMVHQVLGGVRAKKTLKIFEFAQSYAEAAMQRKAAGYQILYKRVPELIDVRLSHLSSLWDLVFENFEPDYEKLLAHGLYKRDLEDAEVYELWTRLQKWKLAEQKALRLWFKLLLGDKLIEDSFPEHAPLSEMLYAVAEGHPIDKSGKAGDRILGKAGFAQVPLGKALATYRLVVTTINGKEPDGVLRLRRQQQEKIEREKREAREAARRIPVLGKKNKKAEGARKEELQQDELRNLAAGDMPKAPRQKDIGAGAGLGPDMYIDLEAQRAQRKDTAKKDEPTRQKSRLATIKGKCEVQ